MQSIRRRPSAVPRRRVAWAAAALAAALVLAACGDDETTAEPACTDFEGDQGTVCVPADAERIVATNYFSYEILRFLGVEPIAVTGVGELPEYLGGGSSDLPDIGTFQERNAVWDAWVAPGNPPARATVEAKLAAPQFKVEIAVVAAR